MRPVGRPIAAASCINAEAETIETSPPFKDAFVKRRCVVPADGFYEWQGRKDHREPLWIHPANGGLLWLPGLYESGSRNPGHWQRTLTIITTRANRLIEPFHDRMPVILDERTADDWINPGERDPLRLKSLLVPAPDDNLVLRPASSLVNNVENDGPELLVPDSNVPMQRNLF